MPIYGKTLLPASYHKIIIMPHIKNISIPQACHQSWQQMTPVNDGRHCQSCCKTVTDFTAMTNDEIINYLTVNSNVCGRFGPQQLNAINNQFAAEDKPATGRLKAWAMAMGLLGSIAFYEASAQTQTPTVQTAIDASKSYRESFPLGEVMIPTPTGFREISGNVSDAEDTAIPGAQIKVDSANISVTTNSNGNFSMRVPIGAKQFTVNYIGFAPRRIVIDKDTKYEVKLGEVELLGEVVSVTRVSFLKRIYYKCIKRPVYKLFK